MDIGTDKDILGTPSKFREVKKKGPGRPKVNKALVIKNLKAKNAIGGPRYTKAQIARMMNRLSARMASAVFFSSIWEWNVSYIILQLGWSTSRQKRAPSAAVFRK